MSLYMKDAVINFRIKSDIKEKAQKILEKKGYTVSEAIRLFLEKTIKDKTVAF